MIESSVVAAHFGALGACGASSGEYPRSSRLQGEPDYGLVQSSVMLRSVSFFMASPNALVISLLRVFDSYFGSLFFNKLDNILLQ